MPLSVCEIIFIKVQSNMDVDNESNVGGNKGSNNKLIYETVVQRHLAKARGSSQTWSARILGLLK
jgi:hypothetical protein